MLPELVDRAVIEALGPIHEELRKDPMLALTRSQVTRITSIINQHLIQISSAFLINPECDHKDAREYAKIRNHEKIANAIRENQLSLERVENDHLQNVNFGTRPIIKVSHVAFVWKAKL